jgi:hypothetical protein
MRIANLLPSDPLTGGRRIASGHPLRLRVTDLIRNARLRRGGIDRCGPEDGKNREDQAHVDVSCVEAEFFSQVLRFVN